MEKRAVVMGGGVGGLAAAVALHRSGWDVEVHERAGRLPAAGTALGMWPGAMAALDELTVGDRVRGRAALERVGSLLEPSGAVLGRIDARRGVHLIARGRLLTALLEALPRGTVRWSSRFDASDALPHADLVVGADGIDSQVRAACWGSSVVRPLGTIAYRGVVAGAAHAVTETWGAGAMFGITPSSDDATNWFACLRGDAAPARGLDPVATLRHVFGSWHPAVTAVLHKLEPDGVDRRELFDVRLPHRYIRGRVALVGDAAHAMAPNLGRGACESLIDAVALARALASSSTVAEGLRRYDAARRPATQRVVRAARALHRVSTAQRGTRMRDAVVRAALRRR